MITKLLALSFLMFTNASQQNIRDINVLLDNHYADRYLKPEDVAEIPRSVRIKIQELGCLIPHSWQEPIRESNVFSGEFGQGKGQDWVIVCSRNGHSQTLIFWNGRGDRYSVIDNKKDYFSDVVAGLNENIWFRISKYNVPKYWSNCENNRLPKKIRNDAIVYDTLDKGGLVYYYHKGKFITCGTD